MSESKKEYFVWCHDDGYESQHFSCLKNALEHIEYLVDEQDYDEFDMTLFETKAIPINITTVVKPATEVKTK